MSLGRIATTLLEELGTSRVTIRLAPGYAVDVEVLAAGVHSVAHTRADPDSATFRLLAEEGLVVQDDVRTSPPAMPGLIEKYGAYAQMLAALVEDGEMVGLIAVHQLRAPREWTDDEVGRLTSAAEQARRELATAH